jgi:cellulose synthase/poly-beta-1,6-N-acetylglucosamine synthase-like glycosyltransferase
MPIWAIIIVSFYSFTLIFVFSFSLAQLHLVYCYLFSKKSEKLDKISLINQSENLPFVTIQLPVYNEMYVIERLLDSINSLEYPKNKLEIQVLDDSTDETSKIIKVKIEELKSQCFEISHIQRKNRVGFKAGALAYGLTFAKGEFIAIFDADFIIKPSFLLETLPYFNDQKIGLVQTRWLHLNENYSLLTKLQAFGLDAHFTVDQVGRNIGGYFSNFNGTGGIWRKTCIETAGGWSADCLTEDLDLSYRAQLAGWKFKYIEETGNFAELPAEIQAVKSQQFRWAKGAAEVAKKLLFKILGRKDLSFSTKIHAFFHLANSATYLGIMATSILTIPVILIQKDFPKIANYIQFAQYFQISFLFLGMYFWVSFRQKNQNFLYFLGFYPRFLAFMMGLSLYNSVGVLQGYFGKKSPFIRTPKFNINSKSDSWLNKNYVSNKLEGYFLLEGLLSFYFLGCLIYVIKNQIWSGLPFFLMLVFGYFSVFGYGVFHRIVNWGK